MITLENDRLQFTFPEIESELRRLIDGEAGRLTSLFLAENRAAAFKTMLRETYHSHQITAEYKEWATEVLLALTPALIQKATRDYIAQSRREVAMEVSFQRTLRIPDDGKTYPLPPGLGRFPLVHVDDHAERVPAAWNQRGGVMMPMYQAEALWILFRGRYPFAVKVATGKINAVSGQAWSTGLHRDPQDYVIVPSQPWLDGYCVEKGLIRQFVAMPLGKGYSAEEQITGEAEYGGLQLQVVPLKAAVHFEQDLKCQFPRRLADILPRLLPVPERNLMTESRSIACCDMMSAAPASIAEMGLGAGGTMRQEVYQDWRSIDEYDQAQARRCFVHVCNSEAWQAITGGRPPQSPVSAEVYARHRLPWFDHYRDDLAAVEGPEKLAALKTVNDLHEKAEGIPLPDNKSVLPKNLVQFGLKRRPKEVVEWVEEEEKARRA